LGITPLTEYPVAQEALTIDVVIRLAEGDLEKLCAVTPFYFFLVHNLIEFKSPRDPLNLSEYRLIIGRVYVYLSQQEDISRHQISSCVITSTKPVKVLTKLKDEVIFTKIADGHYVSDDKIPMHVLVTTELPFFPNSCEFGYKELSSIAILNRQKTRAIFAQACSRRKNRVPSFCL